MPADVSLLDEVGEKSERIANLARASGLAGIVLSTQPNFAWLTAGRTNRIDGSRETGNGAILITGNGRRFALANRIEAPRLGCEALVDLGFEIIEYSWIDERANPALPFQLAERAAGGAVGSDLPSPGAVALEAPIAGVRAPLMAPELNRYRAVGQDLGRILGAIARQSVPGSSESDVAAALTAALAAAGVRPVVLLVAADERIARYRHPTPTGARWHTRLMIASCGERGGLVAAASRLVTVRPPGEDLSRRTHAAAAVYAALLARTHRSATGAQLFEAAASAYAAAGFPGEERLHHQGGAIGYRSREWIAHPRSDEIVTPPQAFAWNPTVTGTKIEETSIVHDDGRHEILTSSPQWPPIEIHVDGAAIQLPGVLVLDGAESLIPHPSSSNP